MKNNEDLFSTNPTGDIMPLLTVRREPLFPGVSSSVHVGRPQSLTLIRNAEESHSLIMVCCQYDAATEAPTLKDISDIGTICRVTSVEKYDDKTVMARLEGISRAKIVEQTDQEPYLKVRVRLEEESEPKPEEESYADYTALAQAAYSGQSQLAKNDRTAKTTVPRELKKQPAKLINTSCVLADIDSKSKIELLRIDDIHLRGVTLLTIIKARMQALDTVDHVMEMVPKKISEQIEQQQRQFVIRRQIEMLRRQLGEPSGMVDNMPQGEEEDDENDIALLRRKADKKKWSADTRRLFDKELAKLSRINPGFADYQVQYAYLSTLLDLPWNELSHDNINIAKAEKTINRNHYGMEKAKERILEYLAVLKLKGDMKSPIICLYGPPGVGKTSLGKAIAETIGRKYVRVSFGGVNDESEIRGHRRTYVGAMPGRIISNIAKCGTSNPVFILDEVDKLGRDSVHGDPSSALLEVLDPEQNTTFHDNYLDTDYDLSHVLFVATANDVASIPSALRDRMEMIEVTGYVPDEKVEIAMRHLIPQELEKHGIDKSMLKIGRDTVRQIIERYTRESGVRGLDKQIAKLMRRAARLLADRPDEKIQIKPGDLKEWLGHETADHDSYDIEGMTGVVTGLAWTQVGGEILFIETALNHAKEAKLSMTGSLGDVMKESAALALEYIKSHTEELGVEQKMLDEHGIHVHVPEGATPKDGPSAGITILTAMMSSLTGRKVKNRLAMSGEITLRGKLLPVGGIKEKILAAKRAGIKEIILSKENEKDIEEIKEDYIKGLDFHFVRTMQEALDIALLKA